jgi:hypothetical protein
MVEHFSYWNIFEDQNLFSFEIFYYFLEGWKITSILDDVEIVRLTNFVSI